MHGRAAERIDADPHTRRLDQIHVHDIGEIGDVGCDVIMGVHIGRLARTLVADARDTLQPRFHVAVRLFLDLSRDIGVGRAAMRRIVFVAAVFRRIVRRRDHDAIGEPIRPALVVGQDRVRDRGRGRIAAALVDHDVDAVGGEHFDGARQRGLGKRMRVDADEQRPGETRLLAVVADRLGR